MTIQQAKENGWLSENEVARLRSDIVNCPRCGRLATQGEIEDLGICCACDHISSDVYDAERS